MGLSGHAYFKEYRHGQYWTDAMSILTYIALGVNTILFFFHAYYIWQFWIYRDSIAIARRHPLYVMLFDLMLLLFFHVYSPYQVFLVCVQSFRAPFWTAWFAFGFTCFGVSWIFLMRSWLLYYAHGYHSAIAQIKDSSHWFIDNAHTWGKPEWIFWRIFWAWLFWTCTLTGAAIFVGTVYPRWYSLTFVTVCLGCGGPFGVVLILWYKLQAKQDVKDVFHIQDELVAGGAITMICCALYGVDHICWLFVFRNNGSRVSRDRIDSFIYYILCFIWGNTIMYFSTARTLFQNERFLDMKIRNEALLAREAADRASSLRDTSTAGSRTAGSQSSEEAEAEQSRVRASRAAAASKARKSRKQRKADREAGADLFDDEEDIDEDEIVKADDETKVDVYEVLVFDQCFKLFSDHLRREFSGEILYGFVELTQWVIHCLGHDFWKAIEEKRAAEDAAEAEAEAEADDDDADAAADDGEKKPKRRRRRRKRLTKPFFLPNFAGNAPTSKIIEKHPTEESDRFQSFKQIAHDMLVKYILPGSPLELNIPSSMRNRLMRPMQKKDEWLSKDVDEEELLFLFEKVRLEMKKMLHFSLNLMKSTDQWPLMVEAIDTAREKGGKDLSDKVSPDDYKEHMRIDGGHA
jgi:hypothetical protein